MARKKKNKDQEKTTPWNSPENETISAFSHVEGYNDPEPGSIADLEAKENNSEELEELDNEVDNTEPLQEQEVKTESAPIAERNASQPSPSPRSGDYSQVHEVLKAKARVLAFIEGKSGVKIDKLISNLEQVYNETGYPIKKEELSNCKSCNQAKINKFFRSYLAFSHAYLQDAGQLPFWQKVRIELSNKGLDAAIEKVDSLK